MLNYFIGDVLLLADVFEAFRDVSLVTYELDQATMSPLRSSAGTQCSISRIVN